MHVARCSADPADRRGSGVARDRCTSGGEEEVRGTSPIEFACSVDHGRLQEEECCLWEDLERRRPIQPVLSRHSAIAVVTAPADQSEAPERAESVVTED